MPAIFISSWDRQRGELPYDSARSYRRERVCARSAPRRRSVRVRDNLARIVACPGAPSNEFIKTERFERRQPYFVEIFTGRLGLRQVGNSVVSYPRLWAVDGLTRSDAGPEVPF